MRAALVAVALVVAFATTPAQADHVSCGDVITADTTLDSDLDCGDFSGGGPPALTIGADGVTLDLDGHTISTTCETGCGGTVVVDDRGGYDRVQIIGGTIRSGGVHTAVALGGVEKSTLEDLAIFTASGIYLHPAVGISLSNSHRNRIEPITIAGGDPSLLLSASDRNRIARSALDAGIGIHEGDGVHLLDGSDHNRIVDSQVIGALRGVLIGDSVGTRVRRSDIRGYTDAIVGSGAHRSVVTRSVVGHTMSADAIELTSSNEMLIRHNEVTDALSIGGDGNRVEHNQAFAGISVLRGYGNLVRENDVRNGWYDGIAVASDATNTLVEGNHVTNAPDDGIDVEAPGTIIRANTATDNDDLGIEAVAGVIDGGGNRASGNGNPLQCVNVHCHVPPDPTPPPATPPATDTDAPTTTITKSAPNKTDEHKVKFKFISAEAGSTFECRTDKKPWRPCSSPTKMKRLDEGKHKFKVRATDPAGNTGKPAKDKFKVVD